MVNASSLSNELWLNNRLAFGVDLPESNLGELRRYLGDALQQRRPQSDGEAASARLVIKHVAQLDTSAMREVEPGVFGRQGEMVDAAYRTHVSGTADGQLSLESSITPLEWIMWSMQLLLLQGGASFVHGAGVEKDGETILFPSWGGVGKTAIAKGFVRDSGWRLLGDDMVIVSRDGTCYGFPKPMVLYPYHRAVFPDVFEQGSGPVAPGAATRLLTEVGVAVKPVLRKLPGALAWARKHNPQSARVAPSRVFGDDALASAARVKAVVWLERDPQVSETTIQPADETFLSRIAGTTMGEFDRHCVGLTPTMCGLGIVPFNDTLGAWYRIIESAMGLSQRWMLSIPADLPVVDVPAAVKRALHSVDLFEETA